MGNHDGYVVLASAYGQYVAGILGAGMSNPDEKAPMSERLDGYTNGYLQLSIYALVTGMVILLAARWLNRLMEDKTQ